MPSFENYEELQEILTEAFAIYEDFKTEVLKVDWEQKYDLDLNKMTYKEYEIYKKISFVERYEKLSVKFQFEERLDYSKENVLDLIKKIGYTAKYVKKDNFFKIEEKKGIIKFYLNICLKYSNVELVIGATNIIEDKFLIGGVFVRICTEVNYYKGISLDENIKKPKFRNYEELQEILTEAFAIYEDFKTEVLKVDWEQ